MTYQIQTTGIIRQRGQITLPDDIRENVYWATAGSVVTIATTKLDEIVIRPYAPKEEVNWVKLWQDIRRVRSYKGRGRGNLSAFVAEDRQTRR